MAIPFYVDDRECNNGGGVVSDHQQQQQPQPPQEQQQQPPANVLQSVNSNISEESSFLHQLVLEIATIYQLFNSNQQHNQQLLPSQGKITFSHTENYPILHVKVSKKQQSHITPTHKTLSSID
jgi:hypothetical protein